MAQLHIQELDRLTADLASFSRAGIPMPEGLRQLERTLGPGALREVTGHLALELERGVPLSQAFETSAVKVPPEYAALLRCAETAGDVRPILDFTVEHSRLLRRHRSALATALLYPAMVAIILFLCASFLLAFIVPKFKDIYDQLGAELPAPTQLMVNASQIFASAPGFLLILVAVGLVVAVLLPPTREYLFQLLGHVPGLASLTALSDTALFMKTIAYMTSRGVPLPDTLRVASLAMWQPATRDTLRSMAGAAEGGHPVGPLLRGNIPATAAWLFTQAEQRGNLAEACEGIAHYCEDRFDRLSKRALAVIEPSLLLLVAIAVGTMVIAMYLPLFNIPKIVGKG